MQGLSDSFKIRVHEYVWSIRALSEDGSKKRNLIEPRLDIAKHLEILQDHGFCNFVVLGNNELKSAAEASFEKNKILLSERTYIAACNDDPEARFIIAHEIGHLLLHRDKESSSIGYMMEEEANYFAVELLAPTELLAIDMKKYRTKSQDFARIFGIEPYIAEMQRKAVEKEVEKHGVAFFEKSLQKYIENSKNR
ncbi:MAG: ImmA/IrrE family metallo-endopeptidase [Oscillospiraceae bacterium]|nr:ImmA/IrrE family metallo-endopeptidase [Oscillospiraceae bacterium]